MAGFVKAAKSDEIAPGQGKMVELNGKKIAIFNVGGAFYAIDDTCTHRGGPLSQGEVSGTTVTCPWHRAQYDLKTGGVLGPPAPQGVVGYKVVVEGDDVRIEL
jgi:nitrite reductase/ring-hydroxylating ferredoxin subunit